MPIKIVDLNHETDPKTKRVVTGKGLVTSVAGVLQHARNSKKTKRVLRILLDSGSDGDLLFVQEGTKIDIPFKERYAPQKWRTSNGTFTTTKVGKMKLVFPEFSSSKDAYFSPDVITVPKSAPSPVYDLIIGIKSLTEIGAILNFSENTLTIDKVTLPMRQHDSFMDLNQLSNSLREHLEPQSTLEATHRAVEILDANYDKADLPNIVNEKCKHLNLHQRQKLLKLLTSYEELFDGTLGDWQTKPISFQQVPGTKPYHGRAFPVPHIHLKTLKKEVERLVELGVLKRQPSSEWASPTFIIPKKNKTVRFISDFREVNKRLVRTPFPIPKISTVLQEMEGFTYATALDLNMGYYTIRLDSDAQKICTIILPWGKYSYLRLPMGVAGSPDIFQEKMSGLMETLEYVRTYLDDLLIITRSSFDDHLTKMSEVLSRLRKAGLRINAAKSFFAEAEIEYLGYVLTREGIKPQPEKISAILAIKPPNTVKELRKFLGMVQYYRDLWEKRSHLLAPLTDLVGECGVTKATRKNKTKKKPWYWDSSHQEAFDAIKQQLAREVMLAYPDYSLPFDIYTDASSRQLGAVITQKGKPIAFFSRKLSETQQKYSVTELELLSIVETLKEFKGMLWGQRIKVFTDHKNLMQNALGMTSDRVYRWRLLLEEYGPVIEYIKGIDNTVADAMSRLEYDPDKNTSCLDVHQCYCHVATLFSHYMHKHDDNDMYDSYVGVHNQSCETSAQVDKVANDFANSCLATTGESEEEIYPATVSEIAANQRNDKTLKRYFKKNVEVDPKDRISLKVIDNIDVLLYDNKRLVIPTSLQTNIVTWYHHYLQHPGHTRLEETIAAAMYWRSLRTDVRRHVKKSKSSQMGKRRKRKYGHLPAKIAETVPWRSVCVDLVGPYTIKAKDKTILDFMCLTMIDPATGWFEIIELPLTSVTVTREGEEITEVIIDKSSASVANLFNKQWLSRYPRAKNIIYDNGSEFKLNFQALCKSYGLERKPTTVKNPQANAILERIHGVFTDMLRTANLDMQETCSAEMIDDFLVAAAWAIRSTYHTVLKSSPGAAVFGRDMLFDIPYIADWTAIGNRRQASVDQMNTRENSRRVDFDYAVGQKVLLKKDGILRKAEDKYVGPYNVTQVHTNGTIRIQRGTMSERINIRRATPYFE